MTTAGQTVDPRLLADVTRLLVGVIGQDWAARITPEARLDADLRMESIELLALADALREHYGERVDLPAFVATLDIDQIIELSVGDIVGYVRESAQ